MKMLPDPDAFNIALENNALRFRRLPLMSHDEYVVNKSALTHKSHDTAHRMLGVRCRRTSILNGRDKLIFDLITCIYQICNSKKRSAHRLLQAGQAGCAAALLPTAAHIHFM
jgi:hypothetical protein